MSKQKNKYLKDYHLTFVRSDVFLLDELNMEPYNAPKQFIASTGLQYIFYVDKDRLSKSEQRHVLHVKDLILMIN